MSAAADIVSLSRGTGQEGWDEAVGGYGRSKLVREILSGRYEPVRDAIWRYHFTGLDSLAFDRPRALQNILGALEAIGKVRVTADPQNVIIKLFFDTKYQEIAGLFRDYGDPAIYLRLSSIDPNHQQTYEQYRTGRK